MRLGWAWAQPVNLLNWDVRPGAIEGPGSTQHAPLGGCSVTLTTWFVRGTQPLIGVSDIEPRVPVGLGQMAQRGLGE